MVTATWLHERDDFGGESDGDEAIFLVSVATADLGLFSVFPSSQMGTQQPF